MFVDKLPQKYNSIEFYSPSKGYYFIYDPDTFKPVGPRGLYCSDYILDWFSGRYPQDSDPKDIQKEIQKKKVFLFSAGVHFLNTEEDKKCFENLERIETENGIKPTTIYLTGKGTLLFECDPIYTKYSHLTSFILKFYRDYAKPYYTFEELVNILPNSFLFKNKKLLEVCKNDTTYTGWAITSLESHGNCGIASLSPEQISCIRYIKEKEEQLRGYRRRAAGKAMTDYWNRLITNTEKDLLDLKNIMQSTANMGVNSRYFTYLTLVEDYKKQQQIKKQNSV